MSGLDGGRENLGIWEDTKEGSEVVEEVAFRFC